jgi:hypothetical protein
MVNYSDGKIYKIEPTCEHEDTEIYVGSTAQLYLSKRFAQHLDQYKHKENHNKRYEVFQLFDKYGTDKCEIILLESFPCANKDELCAREGHFQRKLQCVNKVMIGRTKAEYFQDNKEKFSKLHKEYVEEHKGQVQEYQDQYRKDNREEILAGKKAHYAANKDRLLKQQKEYKEKNKEMIRAKANARIECDCGGSYARADKARHMKSPKHIGIMSTKNE